MTNYCANIIKCNIIDRLIAEHVRATSIGFLLCLLVVLKDDTFHIATNVLQNTVCRCAHIVRASHADLKLSISSICILHHGDEKVRYRIHKFVSLLDVFCCSVAFASVIVLRVVTLATSSANNVLLNGLRQFASE